MNLYNDIIDIHYHSSGRHRAMPLCDRAAQFAPFAALTGFDALIEESERYTDTRPELCDDDADMINKQLAELIRNISCLPSVEVVYFREDKYKSGGSFITKAGQVRLIDTVNRQMIFCDKTVLSIDDLIHIELKAEK